MWRCGVAHNTRVLRFVWKQNYRDILPPAGVSAYVGGQLRWRDHDGSGSGGVPVVVESPSDATGVFAFTADSTETALRALRDVTRSAGLLPHAHRCLAIDRLAALLKENADLLSSADALATGMCLREARRSVTDAVNFLAFCRRRLLLQEAEMTGDSASVYAEEVLHSLGCCANDLPKNTTCGKHSTGDAVTLCLTGASRPLQWGIEALATALLRGSAAVWLPSLETPLSALWLMHLLHRANKDAVVFPAEAINIILCRANDVLGAFARQFEGVPPISGLTNGFRCQEAHRFQCPRQVPSGSSSGGAAGVINWHHRVVKPSWAIVGSNCHRTAGAPAVPLEASEVAKRICRYAFSGNGRTLHPLHIVFLPQQDVPSVLRCVVQFVRHTRLGHSLDPTVDAGPLPGAAQLAAMKDAVEAAVCCGAVRLEQVFGGFEVAMPAGFFCLPCAFYGSVAKVSCAETEASVRAMCATTARLRADLDRLGGGPLVVVCGYDRPRQVGALEGFLRRAGDCVLHRW